VRAFAEYLGNTFLHRHYALQFELADGLATVADQMEKPGGTQAANLRVAENYLEQFGKLAKEGNTMILPTDLANISGLVSSLTSVIKQAKA
jgi:hypothetical protein